MKTYRTAAAVLLACLALSACGGQDGGGSTPTPSQTGGSTVTTPPASDPADPTAAVSPSGVPPTAGTKPPRNPGTPPPGATTLTGTVTAGVEPNCLLLDGYLLIGGPRELLKPGARVTVTGKVEPGLLTTCQQGTPFKVDTATPA